MSYPVNQHSILIDQDYSQTRSVNEQKRMSIYYLIKIVSDIII